MEDGEKKSAKIESDIKTDSEEAKSGVKGTVTAAAVEASAVKNETDPKPSRSSVKLEPDTKPTHRYSLRGRAKPGNEAECDIEIEGTRFDVLDMVEEPVDEEMDTAGDGTETTGGEQSDSSKACNGTSESVVGGAVSSGTGGTNKVAAADDAEMEEVCDAVDENKRSKFDECYVAERPRYAAKSALPDGWKEVYHESGATIYVHLETNVCSLSRPYFLGIGSTKNHVLPGSAVPCYSYKIGKEKNSAEENVAAGEAADAKSSAGTDTGAVAADISAAAAASIVAAAAAAASGSGSAAPAADTSASSVAAAGPSASAAVGTCPAAAAAAGPSASVAAGTCPAATASTSATASGEPGAEELVDRSEEEKLIEYCKRLFRFKTIKYLKFRSWDVRRTYLRALRNERNRRKCPIYNNKCWSMPIEMKDNDGNVLTTKKWFMNPRGRSYVAILHEYLQQSKKTQPEYKFSEVDNARTPYAATVVVNGVEYGSGVGMSKKEAKFEAAKATLQVLLPKMMKYVLSACCDKPTAAGATTSSSSLSEVNNKLEDCSDEELPVENVASVFDDIEITDPRITELSVQTTEPKPYELLLQCLRKKKYNQQEVQFDFKDESEECSMSVGEHKVTIKCDNKRDGRQLAAQALLRKLHPHVTNWGSLLRLYGNCITNQYTQVNEDKDVEELKTRPVSKELLSYLSERLGVLRDTDDTLMDD